MFCDCTHGLHCIDIASTRAEVSVKIETKMQKCTLGKYLMLRQKRKSRSRSAMVKVAISV